MNISLNSLNESKIKEFAFEKSRGFIDKIVNNISLKIPLDIPYKLLFIAVGLILIWIGSSIAKKVAKFLLIIIGLIIAVTSFGSLF